MKLTKKSEYAIKILVGLAADYGKGAVLSRDIAERQSLPQKFVPQIINSLAKAGLLIASRGAGGGIAILPDPQNITVKDVIEAVEGPIAINHCLLEPGICSRQLECQLFGLWGEAQKKMLEVLQSVTIKDLLHAKTGRTEDSKTFLLPRKYTEMAAK